MASDHRPVTGLDLGVSKGCFAHVGLIYSGHLDVDRLRVAANTIIDKYPELKVVVRRTFSLGGFTTPSASKPAWDFQSRKWPDKTLQEVFGVAAVATTEAVASSTKATYLGRGDTPVLGELFSFGTPSQFKLGIADIPVLMFRATLLGPRNAGHTALGLVVPHVVLDGQATFALIRAWGKVYGGGTLTGRDIDPHPDLMSLLGSSTTGDDEFKGDMSPDEQYQPGTLDALRYIWQVWGYTSRGTEEHYFCLPSAVLEKIRDEARALQGATQGRPVSKMDVFCAIMLKLYVHSSLVPQSHPFDFYQAYTLFPSFPPGTLPTPYLHNFFVFGLFPQAPASTLRTEPLPRLALAICARLEALRTPAQARAQLRFHEAHGSALAVVPRRDARHGWGMVTSWDECYEAASGFASSSSSSRDDETGGKTELVFVRPHIQFPVDLSVPNLAQPVGDGKGGLWVRVMVLKGDWEGMWTGAGLSEL